MNTKTNSKKDTDSKALNPFGQIVHSAEASKLSPKATGKIQYEVALHQQEKQLYIHLAGQTDSGLFSKEWIPMDSVLTIIEAQKDNAFKSAVFRPLFKSGSSNNVSFFSSVMRNLGLIVKSDASIFLHQISPDYAAKKKALLAMAKPATKK